MNIGMASQATGLPPKTIRYYEEIKLITPHRGANHYRDYSDSDVQRLRLLQRSRRLGFSIDECRQLLSLYTDKQRASEDVKKLAIRKVDEIDIKIDELQSLKEALRPLIASCHGDERPDCPILDDLAGLGAD